MSVNLGDSSLEHKSRGGGFRRRRTYGAMAEINVTNLVDVVLVLLIIFMISAPLLQSGIEVDLPKSASTAIDPDEDGVVITIDNKGGIYIGGTWAKLENFESQLSAELKKAETKAVFLQADSLVQYGVVIDVIARLKEAGISDLGLMTQPLERNARRKK